MLALARGFPFHGCFPAFPAREKAEVLARHDFRDGKAVVHFREVNIRGADACHLVGLRGSFGRRGYLGERIPFRQSAVAGLTNAGDSNRVIGVF